MFKKISAALVAMSLVAVSQPASAQTSGFITNGSPVTIKDIKGNLVNIAGSFYQRVNPTDYFTVYEYINTKETADTATKGIWLNNVPVSLSALKPGMSCFVMGWVRFTSSRAPITRPMLDGEAPPPVNTVGFLDKMVCKG